MQIQKDFSSSDCTSYPGYKVQYKVLNAADFGVPQKRKRLFIIGIRSDLGIEPPFPDRHGVLPISVGEAIHDLPELEPIVRALGIKAHGSKQKDLECGYKFSPQSDYQEKMRKQKKEGEGVWNHLCRSHNDKDIAIFEFLLWSCPSK